MDFLSTHGHVLYTHNILLSYWFFKTGLEAWIRLSYCYRRWLNKMPINISHFQDTFSFVLKQYLIQNLLCENLDFIQMQAKAQFQISF